MATVLVVDDERDYREQLAFGLSRDGHTVMTAASGRAAIEAGSRNRPNVLIADWMLKDFIHGLHVAEALKTVDPSLKSILITGFASEDLRREAGEDDVFDFIEKPFDMERIRHAVSKAAQAERSAESQLPVGIVEIDGNGKIVYANEHARELFAQTSIGRHAERLSDLFDNENIEKINHTSDRWMTVMAESEQSDSAIWNIRSRRWTNSPNSLLVILGKEEFHYQGFPVVNMILGLTEPTVTSWPSDTHVLVVDDQEWVRLVIVEGLRRVGCICHAACSHEEAVKLFERDPAIKVVILDYDMPRSDATQLVTKLREMRPDTLLVGSSGMDRSREFSQMGVNNYLQKPWTIDDLYRQLSS